MESMKQLIGEHWVGARSGKTLDNVNPATEQVIGQFPRSDREDVERAMTTAEEAYEGAWRKIAAAERGRLLARFADLVERDSELIGTMDSEDMGKPLADAIALVAGAVGDLRYYAGLTDKIEGKLLHAPAGQFAYTVREPFGVVAAIVPWNFPVNQAMIKVAPALAAGNAMILKPSEIAPRSALHLGKLALEAGLPPGTLNVITGLGDEAGAALVEHPRLERLSFTGSSETGRHIVRGSAVNFKKLTLELGGKTANIVMPDANMDAAVTWANRISFFNSGQICTTGSRLLLHKDIKDKFLSRFVERASRIAVGDPTKDGTTMGPVCSKDQYDKVQHYLKIAKKENARFLLGGDEAVSGSGGKGFYVQPTILDGVSRSSAVAQEEIFGPVLTVFEFSNEDEAVEIANDTSTGLASDLWTQDLSAAHRIAGRIQAGIIWINCSFVVAPWMPYGGFKQSGSGFESGPENIEEFTRIKTVIADLTGSPDSWGES